MFMNSLVHKKVVLKLNKHWIPFDVTTPYDIMPGLFNGNFHPVNMGYESEDDEYPVIELITSIKDWLAIPVSDNDIFIGTPKGKFKIPSVVVAQNYDKIKRWEPRLTKNNIMTRDGGICQYSGVYVGKNGNIDHVDPVSRGGRNTWENMVWCDRNINTRKGDRTPSEAGLTLLRKPVKPNTFTLNYSSLPGNPFWAPFLKSFTS